jgi:hypothetical protein
MPLGRPNLVNVKLLLIWEQTWFSMFCGLRDGRPEADVDVPGGVAAGMLVKARLESRRRILQTIRPGEPVRVVTLRGGYGTMPSEIQEWSEQAEKEEQNFNDLVLGHKSEEVHYAAIPAERDLFNALLRTTSPAEVRRICRRSKFWLKYKWDFGNGHFYENPFPCPRALYERAEEFCQSKLDPLYPARDRRPSGDYRRIHFFARVMAGLSLPKPIRPSYAIELFRKKKLCIA